MQFLEGGAVTADKTILADEILIEMTLSELLFGQNDCMYWTNVLTAFFCLQKSMTRALNELKVLGYCTVALQSINTM